MDYSLLLLDQATHSDYNDNSSLGAHLRGQREGQGAAWNWVNAGCFCNICTPVDYFFCVWISNEISWDTADYGWKWLKHGVEAPAEIETQGPLNCLQLCLCNHCELGSSVPLLRLHWETAITPVQLAQIFIHYFCRNLCDPLVAL